MIYLGSCAAVGTRMRVLSLKSIKLRYVEVGRKDGMQMVGFTNEEDEVVALNNGSIFGYFSENE